MEKCGLSILKFGGTVEQIRSIYDHCKSNDGGELASYIPQLTRDAKKNKRAATLLSCETQLNSLLKETDKFAGDAKRLKKCLKIHN